MNKIERIQNLNQEELLNCVANLITRLGYEDVKIENESVVGISSSALSTETYQFIVFNEKLSGNESIIKVNKSIQDHNTNSLANVIFIVSNHNITKGFQDSIDKIERISKLNFIPRDQLISLLDDNYNDYWKHNDLNLLEYEKSFVLYSVKENDLKRLKIFNDKYQKLLDIFIEPRIYHSYEDKSTNTPVRKRIDIDKMLLDNKNQIISGDAGTGKSTVLKKIGEKLILSNTSADIRNIPIYISATDLQENEYSIEKFICKILKQNFQDDTDLVIKSYKIIALIDSIDEFEKTNQKKILKELVEFSNRTKIKYVIGTRNHEKLISLFEKDGFNTYQIEKFNNEQIKSFVSRFFSSEKTKADELVDSLKENRIIERLPITPLTLSLISILYEENNLEIPATIADIYDNFNSLIIGRTTVTNKIQFLDLSFKERILSLYALLLLEKEDNSPLSKTDFFDYFIKYFKEKTLPIKKGTLEDVLDYLIEHTGILILKDDKWVKFSHDSYMEYYSALEIFKHQREKEDLLVRNFLKHNWQNAAIFYAGKSKDLPLFLTKIIDQVKTADSLDEYFMGILGVGYILQALYQTDNILRKTAVLEALNLSVKTNELTTKLAADNAKMFKNYKLPILQLVNMMYFYENFNSPTVKQPLKLAFHDLISNFRKKGSPVDAYKAINLGFLLDSKRINDPEGLEILLEENELFKDPSLYLLMDFSFEFLNKEKYKSFKESIRKDHYKRISEPVKRLINFPASKLRFTNLDTFNDNKKIKIIVEGKTDAEIIEHAYYCLTNGSVPYWNINSAGNDSGGASEVAKTLVSAKPILDEKSIIIGIFDHDSKGLQEFRGLKDKVFPVLLKDTLKKHKDQTIYAICLPVPGQLDFFLQKEQEFNFFEIEHYFEKSLLESINVIEETAIPYIFKIKESKKKQFSKTIREQKDPKIFVNFLTLFRMIDDITGWEVDYIEN